MADRDDTAAGAWEAAVKRVERRNIVYLGVVATALVGWWAAVPVGARVPDTDAVAQLSQRVDALETRIRTLEQEQAELKKLIRGGGPNSPGSSGSAGAQSGAAGGSSGAAGSGGSNASGSENVTRFKAPFEIDDAAGKPMIRVTDEGGAHLMRVYDASGSPGIKLGTADGAAALIIGPANDMTTHVWVGSSADGHVSVDIVTGRALRASMRSPTGTGQFNVYNPSGEPIATLGQGNNGGKLELSDLGGTLLVDAGVLPTQVGIVRTGPMSRAPGGLMGVPGSYISGKR